MFLCRLEGNPICNPTSIVTASSSICGTQTNDQAQAATSWNSPLTTNACGFSCSNGLSLNPQDCNCSVPLIVTLEIRSPTFSNIDNSTLWDLLKDQTLDQLNLDLLSHKFPPLSNDSIWVVLARFSWGGGVDVEMNIFPASGDRFDQNTTDFIMQEFTLQKMKYDNNFKPYRVLSFGGPAGTFFTLTHSLNLSELPMERLLTSGCLLLLSQFNAY
jgi:hypothetical protein